MYTTRQNIEQLLGLASNALAGVDSFVTMVITAVGAYIDQYCGKTFVAASTTKYYDGNGECRLRIDPFIGNPTSVRVLETDGTELQTLTFGHANDYITYPLNTVEKNELVLVNGASLGEFPHGIRRVEVIASFGNAASVPKPIELAATQLAAQVIEKRTKGGTAASETLGDYSISFKDVEAAGNVMNTKAILDQYIDIAI